MNIEEVYRYYGWKIEDGDYNPKESYLDNRKRVSRIEKLVNLLIAVFVMRNK